MAGVSAEDWTRRLATASPTRVAEMIACEIGFGGYGHITTAGRGVMVEALKAWLNVMGLAQACVPLVTPAHLARVENLAIQKTILDATAVARGAYSVLIAPELAPPSVRMKIADEAMLRCYFDAVKEATCESVSVHLGHPGLGRIAAFIDVRAVLGQRISELGLDAEEELIELVVAAIGARQDLLNAEQEG